MKLFFLITLCFHQAKAMDSGFDCFFGGGPTPSHSAIVKHRETEQEELQQEELFVEQELDGVSMSNFDGMNV